jgi:hypothetical protein
VKTAERTAIQAPAAAKKTVKRAARKVEKAAKAVKPARTAKKSPAPRKRTSRAG